MSDVTPGFDIRPGHEYRCERLAAEHDRLMRRRQWALLRGDMATLSNLDRQLRRLSIERRNADALEATAR